MSTATVSPYSPYGHRSRPRGRERRESIARHEVGHAIVACALGFEDVHVEFEPLDDSGAHAVCRYTPPAKWGAANRRQRELAACFGGHLAEVRAYGVPRMPGTAAGDGEDSARLLEGLSDERRADVTSRAYTLASDALTQFAGDIEWAIAIARSAPVMAFHQVAEDMIAITLVRCEPSPHERAQARAA
jgi:hypothetical protein